MVLLVVHLALVSAGGALVSAAVVKLVLVTSAHLEDCSLTTSASSGAASKFSAARSL